MKKLLLLIVFKIFIMPLFAVDFDFSVAWQPISFFHRVYGTEPTSLFGDEFFEKGQYFTYQSSLRFRSGLNLGFGFGWDSGYDVNNNVVGLVSDVLAFIGYDRFSIRVSHGNSHSIGKTTVDLLMDTYGIDPFTPAPWYMFAGINYTYLESPLPLTSIGGEGYNINAVTHLYGIILGSDLFSYFINKPKNGIEFSFWWDGFISLGIGTTTYQENTEFAWDFRVSYTGGILIAGGSRINWCLGLGYNVDGGFTNLLHHGFVVRFGIKI